MKKKIVWFYPKLEKWMGGTKFVFECAKEFKRLGYDIKLVCQKGTIEVVSEFEKYSIPVFNLNSYTFTDLRFWVTFNKNISNDLKEIKKIVTPEDVIISSMYPMNYLASLLPNKHFQIMYEPFSFFYNKNIRKDYNLLYEVFFKVAGKLYKETDQLPVKKAQHVLTLSEFERNNIYKVYNVDSSVIYEGVDSTFFYKRDTDKIKDKFTGFIPIMHSTGFDSYKGTDYLMEALPELKKLVPNFKLFITYTRVNEQKLKFYYNFITENNLHENVVFFDFIPYEDLPIYYSIARVYIEPGIGRSMSLSNKEAMACGTPVIRGNDSSEEVTDGFNGFLVSPFDKKQIACSIAKLCNDNDLRDKMSKNALRVIKEKFNWEKVVGRIINIIEN